MTHILAASVLHPIINTFLRWSSFSVQSPAQWAQAYALEGLADQFGVRLELEAEFLKARNISHDIGIT